MMLFALSNSDVMTPSLLWLDDEIGISGVGLCV